MVPPRTVERTDGDVASEPAPEVAQETAEVAEQVEVVEETEETEELEEAEEITAGGIPAVTFQAPVVFFQPATARAPEPVLVPTRESAEEPAEAADHGEEDDDDESGRPPRVAGAGAAAAAEGQGRRRGGRGRGGPACRGQGDQGRQDGQGGQGQGAKAPRRRSLLEQPPGAAVQEDDDEDDGGSTRAGAAAAAVAVAVAVARETRPRHDLIRPDAVDVREPRAIEDEVQSVTARPGSRPRSSAAGKAVSRAVAARRSSPSRSSWPAGRRSSA